MPSQKIAISEDLIELLKLSKLADRPLEEQVRLAVAIHLFQEGVISIGKAAELADEPRIPFELFLLDMGIPTMRYGLEEWEQDKEALKKFDKNP
jgi:predicted HTH domain antitoxin